MGCRPRSWRTDFFCSSSCRLLSRLWQSVFHRQARLSSSLSDLFLLLAQLGYAVDDIPPHHHEVIFVVHVVAVDQVSTGEVSELHPQLDRILAWERVNIPTRVVAVLVGIETDTLHLLQIDRHMQIGLIYRIRSGRPLQDSPFFEVNMDWMDPIARKDVVPQAPFLH